MIDCTSLATIFMSPVIGIVSRCDLLIKACHSSNTKLVLYKLVVACVKYSLFT